MLLRKFLYRCMHGPIGGPVTRAHGGTPCTGPNGGTSGQGPRGDQWTRAWGQWTKPLGLPLGPGLVKSAGSRARDNLIAVGGYALC